VPVRARHVAARAVDIDLAAFHPAGRIDQLLQAADLPGDLVHRVLRRQARHHLEETAREDDEGMMIAVEAREITNGLELALVLGRDAVGEIERIGFHEAEQPEIEMQRLLHMVGEKAEMAQAADPERPVKHHAADIEFTVG